MPEDESRIAHEAPAADTYRIAVDGDATGFPCRADQNVLEAMRASGRRVLAVGCRNGGCGVCRIHVVEGLCETRRMSAACVTAAQAEVGVALACRLYPRSDMRIVPAPLRPKLACAEPGKERAA